MLQCNAVYQQDCVEGMQRMQDHSVDLAFADPPFNIGYEYDVYQDRRSSVEYLDWCRLWLTEICRVLKPNGTFWLAIGDEFAAELKVLMQQELQLICRSWVVWYYTFGVNCTNKFSRSHAHLFHMVRNGDDFTFNVDTIRVPSARQLVYGDRARILAGDCRTIPGFCVLKTCRRAFSLTRTRGITRGWRARSRNGRAGMGVRCPNNCWDGSSAPVRTPVTWCWIPSRAAAPPWSSPRN